MNYAHPSDGWEVGNVPGLAVSFTSTHGPCFFLMLVPAPVCDVVHTLLTFHCPCGWPGCFRDLDQS